MDKDQSIKSEHCDDDGYIVKIDCIECGEHFDDFGVFENHLKRHWDGDPNREWGICKECNNKKWHSLHFVLHLCAKHNYGRPFQCIKMRYGRECTYTAVEKSRMKDHIKRIHSKETRKQETEEEMEDQKYVVDVNCNYRGCGEHFDDYHGYTDHVKRHYKLDPNETWMRCNEGKCDGTKKWQTNDFMSHLCTHGYPQPFECTQLIDEKKCKFSTGHIMSMKRHAKINHSAKRKYGIINGETVTVSDCYTFAAECKLCDYKCSDWIEFRRHIRDEHFVNTADREWGVCAEAECGEKNMRRQPADFYSHLCSKHGWKKPFCCNRCDRTFTGKKIREHLKSNHGLTEIAGDNDP